jgi:NADH:ubiquinone oxidoreductase subunit 3 (subunit A)
MGSVSLILLFICGLIFSGMAIGFGKLLSVKKFNEEKGQAYECGIDVEIIFLYPWAVVFKEIGMVAFVEIIFFTMFLFLGLLYAYKKKALTWM